MSNKSPSVTDPLRVLVLCTGNSCRSQMMEFFLRRHGGARVEVASAGSEPHGVNPLTIQVMQEVGIDLSAARSKHLNEFIGQPWDYVITVCDNAAEQCPIFPG
ncbi:MAG: arsenate reductase ArsC, partial [Ardenticatenales bacterium]|nr:arsenate reductase ArsC [Ardenticatenales bacterium]